MLPVAAGAGGKPTHELFLVPYDNGNLGRTKLREEAEALFRQRMICETTLLRWLQSLPGRKIVVLQDLCRSKLLNPRVKPKQATAETPAGSNRLESLSQIDLALIQTWSPPEAALRTDRHPTISWTAAMLGDALERLPAPVTVGQAFAHLKSNWSTKISDPPTYRFCC